MCAFVNPWAKMPLYGQRRRAVVQVATEPREDPAMGKLEGKIALVTGGNSGIGLARAKQSVNEGVYVFITGRRDRELAAAVKDIGGNVTGVQGDVANLGDLDRLFAQIKRQKGRLDIVFANAGVRVKRCSATETGPETGHPPRPLRAEVHMIAPSWSFSMLSWDQISDSRERGIQASPLTRENMFPIRCIYAHITGT
jgi:hypothetical protein